MALKFIDIASHQYDVPAKHARMEEAWPQTDGVIIKATQGTGYVNPHCDTAYQRAKRDNKLRGVYHYASNGNPEAEAEFFVANIKGYIKDAVLVLDWERYQNESNWGNTAWCRRFVDRVHALTGIWPMLYVQASAIAQCANCAKDCALWVAGYPAGVNPLTWTPGAMPYNITPWQTATGWQYTEGDGCDRNLFYLDAAAWKRIATAGATATQPSKPAAAPSKKSDDQIAAEVIAGKWGNGSDRVTRLRQAGYDPAKIQAKVNVRLGATKPAVRTYTVQAGDTLSAIAAKYDTTWTALARKNNLANPNLIYPGQIIRID